MRIAILSMTLGGMSGGYRKYMDNILPLLISNPIIHGVEIYIPERSAAYITNKNNCDIKLIKSHDIYSGYSNLKKRIMKLHPDVVFIPTAQWIDLDGIPIVNMVRNMEPLLMWFCKEDLLESAKNLMRYVAAKRATKKSTRVIAVSEFVRDFLVNRWQITANKLAVIYHGIEQKVFWDSETIPPDKLKCFNVGNFRFIFTAGSIRPARGLEDIIRAFRLVLRTDGNIFLVIGGDTTSRMNSYKKKLMTLSEEEGISSHVIWAGQLNDYEMRWCYKNCEMLVMTSRVEACPNVALEAMASGCLIVSTESPPMPEFFDDVALYYKPGAYEDLGVKINELLRWSSGKKQEVRDHAKIIASKFSWENCAKNTISELKKAIE
ncbi:MAG TPA: hypothetical protein DFI01_08970 [Bacteroidales bacterium]|nr:hypothetical protein [Bacteroidales bacterium]